MIPCLKLSWVFKNPKSGCEMRINFFKTCLFGIMSLSCRILLCVLLGQRLYRVIVIEQSRTDHVHLFFVYTEVRWWATICMLTPPSHDYADCQRSIYFLVFGFLFLAGSSVAQGDGNSRSSNELDNCKLDSVVSDGDKKRFAQTDINFLKKMIFNQQVIGFFVVKVLKLARPIAERRLYSLSCKFIHCYLCGTVDILYFNLAD